MSEVATHRPPLFRLESQQSSYVGHRSSVVLLLDMLAPWKRQNGPGYDSRCTCWPATWVTSWAGLDTQSNTCMYYHSHYGPLILPYYIHLPTFHLVCPTKWASKKIRTKFQGVDEVSCWLCLSLLCSRLCTRLVGLAHEYLTWTYSLTVQRRGMRFRC